MAEHAWSQTIDDFKQQLAGYYQSVLGADEASEAIGSISKDGLFAEPRRDMDPAVAAALGIDLSRPITLDEVANLLSGNRADGETIESKQYQRAVDPLSAVFGLDPMRAPTRDELENLLAGKRADGLELVPANPKAGTTKAAGLDAADEDTDRDTAMAAEMAAMAEFDGEPAGPPEGVEYGPEPPIDVTDDHGRGDEAADYDLAMAAAARADAARGGEPALAPRGRESEPAEEPRAIDVAGALTAARVAYQQAGGRLRVQATWRGGDGWSVAVDPTTGQWRDFAADEGGRFESLVRRLGVTAEARALDADEAGAAKAAEARRDTARKSFAVKIWDEAVPGRGDLPEPHWHGSAGQKMKQRSDHRALVADAEATRGAARAYLTARGLDADWLLGHVKLTRLHPNYDATEIAAGARMAMLTPMYWADDAGRVRLSGIQRTYLTEDGEKIGRRMLGAAGAWLLAPPVGKAVPFAGHDRLRFAGEGFETVASVVQATRQEGLVAYNAGGVARWAALYDGSTPTVVLADRDAEKIHNGRNVGEAGQKAAARAVRSIEENGGEAIYAEPPAWIAGGAKGADWADAMREGGADGLRQALADAVASSASDRARIEQIMGARRTTAEPPIDGTAVQPSSPAAEAAQVHPELMRLHKALGAADGRRLTDAERVNILDGKRADGAALDPVQWRRAVTKSRTPIGYVDFTFSADKTVSIAWAFAPTEAERAAIGQAHREAVQSAMREIEQVIGLARKGQGGKNGVEQGKIGWVAFDHYTARPTLEVARQAKGGGTETEIVTMKMAGDMQLHTHVTVPNTIVTPSGRVVSLNTMEMHGRIHEWGAIYQAHLAQNLRALGVGVELDRTNGAARLSAVPETVRAAFSKRTVDALDDAKAYAASIGADWEKLSPDERIVLLKSGAHASRQGKADDMSDFASWQRQAAKLGYKHHSVLDLAHPAKPLPEAERLDRAYEAAAQLMGDAFAGRAVLKLEDERVAAARGLIAAGVESGADVDKVIARLRERGVVETGVATAQEKGEPPEKTAILVGEIPRDEDDEGRKQGAQEIRLTTRAHVAQETAVMTLASKHAGDRRGALTPKQIAAGIEASALKFEGEHGQAQKAIIDHLGMGGRFAAAIGAAGAGKTTLLKPLVAAWQERGHDIHGLSLGWRQARELRDAGLNTDAETGGRDTIAAVSVFINRVQSGRLELSPRSVVVIDELGTIGTRQLLELLTLQDRHGFRMVAIGDPKQCQSIEAGQVISLLEGIGVPSLDSTVRQTDERARQITGLLREGGIEAVEQALTMKREDKTAEIVPGGHAEVIERAAALWQERRAANTDRPGYTLTISTPSNDDARAIGQAIRAHLQNTGALGRNRMTIATIDPNTGRQFAMPITTGETVRLFARTGAAMLDGRKGAIGDNGSIVTISSVRQSGLVLRNDKGAEGFVKWETLTDKATGRMRLAYGYAMTTNTAQGITSTEHIFVTPGGSQTTDGFKTYVSGSRHRERDYWLTSEGAERQQIMQRRPLGDPRSVTTGDLWENWTANIARRPEKVNATSLDLHGAADGTRREAAKDFLKSLARAEARNATGETKHELPQRFQAARIRVTEQGRMTSGLQSVARYRQAAIERLDRAAPALRQTIEATWAQARPVIEQATAGARARLDQAIADYRRREDQRRAEMRRQAEERMEKKSKAAQQQATRRGRGR